MQKALEVSKSKPADTGFDLFMESGITGVGCAMLYPGLSALSAIREPWVKQVGKPDKIVL